ncbi:MAG: zinc ribbon domain-containing protein [Verrucomicrobiota bacterium]|nr:zinc ribbon domain-containing protein [Verrucomicrobiota bacterium]
MPLFEYKCKTCGKACELLVSGLRRAVCPSCGSTRLEKNLSSFHARAGRAEKPRPFCAAGGGCPSNGTGCAGGGCPHLQ